MNSDVVGDTGFEPATSRPPAVRATNCANPRKTYAGYALAVTFRDPETSSLKTSFQEKISLRTATGSTHPSRALYQLSYTLLIYTSRSRSPAVPARSLDPASTYFKHSLKSVSGLADCHWQSSPQPCALPTAPIPVNYKTGNGVTTWC